ncbi:hypothetical protein HQ447_03480 [bacterium]|nr:hypothetical protein [bacterium]
MKPTTFIAGISAFALASAAYADVTVTVTGATAFRAATLLAIKSKFTASGAAFKFAHDQVAGNMSAAAPNATRALFIGTFPGVTGTTTIKCCFTGSVEGIRAVVGATDPLPPTYYPSTLLDSTTAVVGGGELALNSSSAGSPVALGGPSDIAFSDVSKAITPYASYATLPSSSSVGVCAFTMLTNEGSTITNVTNLQYRALLTAGFQPLSLFTGNTADTTNVFATGRNDGSGTRSSYLSAVGFGVANAVKQYVTIASTSTALGTIQLVPAGGINTLNSQAATGQSAANASTVWGQDIAGNGGYSSGSTLRGDMAKTGLSVTVLDNEGADSFGAPVRADLVTWLSVNDAATARANGAVFCAYNGYKLDGIAASGTVLSAGDKLKITEGQYTAWNYQQMYRRSIYTTGDVKNVYDGIKAAIPSNLAAAGIALTDMHVGRANDGGTVAP